MKRQQGYTRTCIQHCSALWTAKLRHGFIQRVAESSLALCSNLHSLAGWAATFCHLQNIVSHFMTALNRMKGLLTHMTQEHGWRPDRLQIVDALLALLKRRKSLNQELRLCRLHPRCCSARIQKLCRAARLHVQEWHECCTCSWKHTCSPCTINRRRKLSFA